MLACFYYSALTQLLDSASLYHQYISLYLIRRIFQRLLEVYSIDEPDIIIYNSDRTALITLEAIFLEIEFTLYIQYIDTIVKAQAYKIFRQQKSEDSIRYTSSSSIIAIYVAILTGATYNEASDSKNKIPEAIQDDEVDNIIQLVAINKRSSYNYKDASIRQLKIIRYLERYQQVYKEKYVKAQTNKIPYLDYDVSLVGKGIYIGLKKQIATARNSILTLILQIVLFYNSYISCFVYLLSIVQNALSI